MDNDCAFAERTERALSATRRRLVAVLAVASLAAASPALAGTTRSQAAGTKPQSASLVAAHRAFGDWAFFADRHKWSAACALMTPHLQAAEKLRAKSSTCVGAWVAAAGSTRVLTVAQAEQVSAMFVAFPITIKANTATVWNPESKPHSLGKPQGAQLTLTNGAWLLNKLKYAG